MSLRVRLTLRDVILATLGLVLLGTMIYSITTLVVLAQIDQRLLSASENIIQQLRVESPGRFNTSLFDTLDLSHDFAIQLWGVDRRIQYSTYTGNQAPMNPGGWDGGSPAFTVTDWKQSRTRVLSTPLVTRRGMAGVLMVGVNISWLLVAQNQLELALFSSIPFLFVLLILILWYLNGRMLLPLTQMVKKMEELNNSNDLSIRLPVNRASPGEVEDVVVTYNRALDRMENILNLQKRFVTFVGHELRTPLTVIKGEVGILKKLGNVDPESLHSIENEVDRLTRMVGDLLLLAQAETGRLPLDVNRMGMDDVVLEVFQQARVLGGKEIEVILENLEPVEILGDRDRIKQVLLNLVGNAINHTPSGGKIFISLQRVHDQAQVIVRDTGAGIPEEDLPFVFERFFRSEGANKRKKSRGGFGLGLPISYWIVRNHNGKIEVDSQVGLGTTFTVWLPLAGD